MAVSAGRQSQLPAEQLKFLALKFEVSFMNIVIISTDWRAKILAVFTATLLAMHAVR